MQLKYALGERNLARDQARAELVLGVTLDKRNKVARDLLLRHLRMRTAVYAIGRELMPPIKIGFSGRPKTRLLDMQVGSPDDLRFHAVYWLPDKATATKLEAACHKLLDGVGWHVRGEWFDMSPKGAKSAVHHAAKQIGCNLVSHQALVATFPLSKDPLEGCFWGSK